MSTYEKSLISEKQNLKKIYNEYVRQDFINAFKNCNNTRSAEVSSYVNNILSWVDSKLDYNEGSSNSMFMKKRHSKTSIFQVGQQQFSVTLDYKPDLMDKNSNVEIKSSKSLVYNNKNAYDSQLKSPELDLNNKDNNNEDDIETQQINTSKIILMENVKNIQIDNSLEKDIFDDFVNEKVKFRDKNTSINSIQKVELNNETSTSHHIVSLELNSDQIIDKIFKSLGKVNSDDSKESDEDQMSSNLNSERNKIMIDDSTKILKCETNETHYCSSFGKNQTKTTSKSQLKNSSTDHKVIKRKRYSITNDEYVLKKKKKKQLNDKTTIKDMVDNKNSKKNVHPNKIDDSSLTKIVDSPLITSRTEEPDVDFEEVINSLKTLKDKSTTITFGKNMYYRNKNKETQMHIACAKGNLNKVNSLLAQGFNPNMKDAAGWTPLHEAVKIGHLEIVNKLIDYGAYLNVPGFEYDTPLHVAIRYDHFSIAKILLDNGIDKDSINIYGETPESLNVKKWQELMENQIPCVIPKNDHIYEPEQIIIYVKKGSISDTTLKQFCEKFNIKSAKHIQNENKFMQVTHVIVPSTSFKTCDVDFDCLFGIANGLYIIGDKWILDSLKQKKLLNCENYEVKGTSSFLDCDGPKISRTNKQKLLPKLFDGLNIYIHGHESRTKFTINDVKKLVTEFGAKLSTRMPNPEMCSSNILPYHCQNNKLMSKVSTIILYTSDSDRMIKYNMEHIKALPISWFMEVAQKYKIFFPNNDNTMK